MTTLSVLIGGDDRELQAALKRAQSGMRKFGRDLRDGVNDFAKWGAAAAAAGAAVATHLVANQMQAIDAQAKLANALNTSVASLATLQRAAELDGVDQLEPAVRKLTSALGNAANGTGPAVESLKRLHLTAQQLSSLPVDQRIALLNERIREHIPLSEQAAVSADFFGDRVGLAMLNLSPETIREAAEQVQVFGVALSDVDAAKIEQANDAMSTFKLGAEGLFTQISKHLAPILKKLGEEFENAVKEAGGMEAIGKRAFEGIVTGAGFAMDAVDGVKRAFELAADAIIITASVSESALKRLLKLQLQIANVSTLGLSDSIKKGITDLGSSINEVDGVVSAAWDHMEEVLDRPMPSEGLRRFVEEAQKAGQAAAEATVAARESARGNTPEDDGVAMDEAAQRRLDKLREQFMSEEELSFEQREKDLKQIAEFEAKKQITADQANRLREETEQAHWTRMGAISAKASEEEVKRQKERDEAIRRGRETFMDNMAGLMNTGSRKVFEIGKIAAIGQAAYKGSLAVMDAWEAGMSTGGPWAPFIAAAYAAAAGLNAANLINNIRKQQYGGSASTPTAPTQGSSGISPQGMGGGQVSGGGGGPGGPSTIVNLQGEFFTRDQVRRFLEMLNEERADGGRLIAIA